MILHITNLTWTENFSLRPGKVASCALYQTQLSQWGVILRSHPIVENASVTGRVQHSNWKASVP